MIELYFGRNKRSIYLTECTGTSEPTFPLILSTLMSETCLKPAGRPWYSQMSGSKISAKSMYESSSPAYIPQCWLSNSTAQAIALANVNPEVAVTIPLNLSHLSLVTCLATKECLDLMLGNSAILTVRCHVNIMKCGFGYIIR